MIAMFRIAAFGLAVAGLTACETPITPAPPTAAEPVAQDPVVPQVNAPSERSEELRRYYSRVQQSLLIQGLLRTDGGGPDTPFSKRQLVENFIQTAAYSEISLVNGSFVEGRTEGAIARWETPVNVALTFGDSVDASQRQADTKRVQSYLARLSRITSTPMSLSPKEANFHVAVLNVDELAAFGPKLLEIEPNLPRRSIEDITLLPRDTYCAVFSFTDQNRKVKAVAIIREEHPDLLRAMCFHEEIAQGLGIDNDSPNARPSIFNDDNEFALLTRHDELLLQILYDKRLPLGSTPEQARPIVNIIASELLGGES